jgi:hypothetical protein
MSPSVADDRIVSATGALIAADGDRDVTVRSPHLTPFDAILECVILICDN